MKSFKKIRLLLVVFMFLNTPLFAAVRAGSVLDTAGEVSQLKNERGDKILPLKVDDDLLFNDSVMTGDASSTRLLLSPDDKRIRFYVHENSKLKIDPVLIKDGKKNFVTRFSKGLIRIITGKLEGDSVTVITPNATVGIRGSDVQVLTFENGHTTISRFGKEEEEVEGFLVEKGERVTIKVRADVSVIFTPDPKTPSITTTTAIEVGESVTILTDVSTGITTMTGLTAAAAPVSDLPKLLGDDKRASHDYFDILRSRVDNPKADEYSTHSRANGGGGTVFRCFCPSPSGPVCLVEIVCSSDY